MATKKNEKGKEAEISPQIPLATGAESQDLIDNSIPRSSSAEVHDSEFDLPINQTLERASLTARSLPKRKLYQDEVYGSKELSPLAIALIDTPEFQRLGHIYQLGMTHTVFRGGNHRRLDHCIGTYFMSRTLMRRIVQNHARLFDVDPKTFAHPGGWLSPRLFLEAPGTPLDEQRLYSAMGRWRGLTELVSAAALLHDLGHVAVGHTLEDEFSIYEKHDGLGNARLFELLYGPRTLVPKEHGDHTVDRFFSSIDEMQLPRPAPETLRVPLPWVFEEGTYRRFLPNGAPIERREGNFPEFENWEIRDLIFLILSFKETITKNTYSTFSDELKQAKEKAAEDQMGRLEFIEYLYNYYTVPLDLGPDQPRVPIFQPFMADIVGNTICADLLDYLQRDGQRLNLQIRSNPRLQRYLVVRPDSSFVSRNSALSEAKGALSSNLRLTIDAVYRNGMPRRDTISDLLDLMRERYRFAEVVYYHPKKCAFSTMIAKALELAHDYRPRDELGIYPAPWQAGEKRRDNIPHIVHLGDEDLLAYLAHPTKETASPQVAELVRRIIYRDEYRLLFTLDCEAAKKAGGAEKFIRDLRTNKDEIRKDWENRFAHLVSSSPLAPLASDGLPPVLIYCPNIRMQAKEVAARVELIPDQVLTLNRQGEDPDLAEEVNDLNSKYQALWRLYLFIHPALSFRSKSDKTSVTLLSSIVDAFCDKYQVKTDWRKRGARFDYAEMDERVEFHFTEWTRTLPVGIRNDGAKITNVRSLSSRFPIWRTVLGTGDTAYPVSEGEFRRGFDFAMLMVALNDADDRERGQWPEAIRSFDNGTWYTTASKSRVEDARNGAVRKLLAEAPTLFGDTVSARNNPTDWRSLTISVSRVIRGA